MIRRVLFTVVTFVVTFAHAAVPVFVASCPTDIKVEAKRMGSVLINGQKARAKKINDNAYDFKAGYITISVTNNPGKAPDVFYTGKGRANGLCTVTSYDDGADSSAPAQVQTARVLSRASGNIPCAHDKGQPMGQCSFTVERTGYGSATVQVTHPNGRTRVIFFENGKAIAANLSQADGDMSFKVTKESDLFMIRAGKERYEIPEALVFGG